MLSVSCYFGTQLIELGWCRHSSPTDSKLSSPKTQARLKSVVRVQFEKLLPQLRRYLLQASEVKFTNLALVSIDKLAVLGFDSGSQQIPIQHRFKFADADPCALNRLQKADQFARRKRLINRDTNRTIRQRIGDGKDGLIEVADRRGCAACGTQKKLLRAQTRCPATQNLWSGRRGSDPRPTAWKAVTLPLSYSRPALMTLTTNSEADGEA